MLGDTLNLLKKKSYQNFTDEVTSKVRVHCIAFFYNALKLLTLQHCYSLSNIFHFFLTEVKRNCLPLDVIMWGKLCCPLETDILPSKPGILKTTHHNYIWSQPDSSNPILVMSSSYFHNSCLFININMDTDIHLCSK